MSSVFSFLIGHAFRIFNPRAGSLDSLTRCRSLKEESCQAKTVREEGRERARVWNRELMTSDFLCPVTEIFVFALSLVSWIPRITSMSLPFPWSQVEVGSSQLWFRFCSLSFPIMVHLPDTNRGTCLLQHHYEWNPFYSLMRIGCADHQIQFTSILGRSTLSVI